MIRLQNLCFRHGGQADTLCGIDLEIRPDERVALIGPNGSGKTTLARCLNGLYRATAGRVLVDGLDAAIQADLPQIRQRVGMVFQNPDDQLVTVRVEDEIAFGLENLAIATGPMRQTVDETLEAFGLTPLRRRPPHQLSGGEKQRVAIAAAIALQPRYLVLDEPTALLDPASRHAVNALIESLRAAFGLTTIRITQYLEEAVDADRIVVLHQGRLWADGPPGDIFRRTEALRGIGLDVPFACDMSSRLQAHGIPFCLRNEPLAAALAPRLITVESAAYIPDQMPSGPSKLRAEALSYAYTPSSSARQDQKAIGLRDIDIDLACGTALALTGPSGSGKTTLVQHFNGLLRPDRGRVLLDGQDLWARPAALPLIRRRVALVFQFPELQLFAETVLDDAAYGPSLQGLSPSEAAAAARRALAQVGLDPDLFAHRSPMSLSGGEKRRVAIAGSLAMRPEVLVLDEPTAGLDPQASRQLVSLLSKLRRDGMTLAFISHDMERVADLAGRLVVLQDGTVQASGPPRVLLNDPPSGSGLAPPAAAALLSSLRRRGCPVPSHLLTSTEVATYIEAALATAQT